MDDEKWPVNPATVGVLGGMGSYSTLYFFQCLLDGFTVEKEWERPRIVIDNNCVLPSRVRAILYDERRQELIQGMAASIRGLLAYQPDAIVIPCHTAHCFLNDVRQQLHVQDKIVDMIQLVAEYCHTEGADDILLLATEGTIVSKVYELYCDPFNILVRYPDEEQLRQTRRYIELVKKKEGLSPDQFIEFLSDFQFRNIVLGCTELSVACPNEIAALCPQLRLIDPIKLVVSEILGIVSTVAAGRATPVKSR